MKLSYSYLLICAIILEASASGPAPKAFDFPSDFLFGGLMGNNTFYTATIDKQRHLMIWLTNFGNVSDHVNVSSHDPDLLVYLEGQNLRFLKLSWNQPQSIGNEADLNHLMMQPNGTVLIGSSGAKMRVSSVTLLLTTSFVFLCTFSNKLVKMK